MKTVHACCLSQQALVTGFLRFINLQLSLGWAAGTWR